MQVRRGRRGRGELEHDRFRGRGGAAQERRGERCGKGFEKHGASFVWWRRTIRAAKFVSYPRRLDAVKLTESDIEPPEQPPYVSRDGDRYGLLAPGSINCHGTFRSFAMIYTAP